MWEHKNSKELGACVRELAEEKNLSISDMAKILDCSENIVEMFLKGEAYLSFDKLFNLAKALNTSVLKLLEKENE